MEEEDLQPAIEVVFQQLVEQVGESTVAELRPILMTNLAQGRMENWLGINGDRSPQAYVYHVAKTYAIYKDYLFQLQVEKSDEAWQDLYHQLQQWAYNFLLRKGFYSGQSTSQLADTYATEAAVILLTARFPYDRDFVPWTHVLLLNVCRRGIRQATKTSRIPDEKLCDLDQELLDQVDHMEIGINTNRMQEIQRSLRDAIERLPQESWRQVLLLRYFHNLTPSEIAGEMGKTASAVYNLHFKAVAALREVWIEDKEIFEFESS